MSGLGKLSATPAAMRPLAVAWLDHTAGMTAEQAVTELAHLLANLCAARDAERAARDADGTSK